jgi:large subunit ribosomal protein LP2
LSYQQCIAKALESVGLEADDDRLTKLLTELEGKDLGELLEHGTKRLAKLVAVAVAAVVAAEVLLLVAQLLLKQWKKRKKKRKEAAEIGGGGDLFGGGGGGGDYSMQKAKRYTHLGWYHVLDI